MSQPPLYLIQDEIIEQLELSTKPLTVHDLKSVFAFPVNDEDLSAALLALKKKGIIEYRVTDGPTPRFRLKGVDYPDAVFDEITMSEPAEVTHPQATKKKDETKAKSAEAKSAEMAKPKRPPQIRPDYVRPSDDKVLRALSKPSKPVKPVCHQTASHIRRLQAVRDRLHEGHPIPADKRIVDWLDELISDMTASTA